MNGTVRDIGIAGLGRMGSNLALNIADHGYSVAAYDWDEMALGSLRLEIAGRNIDATNSLVEFVSLLRVPRTVMILFPAGHPIDELIDALAPLLDRGDVVIDAANSYFKDTDARSDLLARKGITLLGMGIAGGPRGARQGPSMMPSGSAHAYDQVRHILEEIAADVNGEPCVAYLGPRSAGHYVDMVYCGIEQGILQLIAETYHLMSRGFGLSDSAIRKVYAQWTDSEAASHLLGIIARSRPGHKEDVGETLFGLIVDEANQNRSGSWASIEARDLDVSIPTIDVAVAMQLLSSLEQGRVAMRLLFGRQPIHYAGRPGTLIDQLKRALYAGMILTFAQGMTLLRAASETYNYGLALEVVARIWRGGSILRAPIVQDICDAFYLQPHLPNLLADSQFAHRARARRADLCSTVRLAAEQHIPVPALTASLVYYDAYQNIGPDDPRVLNHHPAGGFLQDTQRNEGSRRLATPQACR